MRSAVVLHSLQIGSRFTESPVSGRVSKVKIMNEHEKINYVEFPARDLEAVKTFFISAFGW